MSYEDCPSIGAASYSNFIEAEYLPYLKKFNDRNRRPRLLKPFAESNVNPFTKRKRKLSGILE
jgi:hypothetical protein